MTFVVGPSRSLNTIPQIYAKMLPAAGGHEKQKTLLFSAFYGKTNSK